MAHAIRRVTLAVALASAACATALVAAPTAVGAPVPMPRLPLVDPCEQFTDPDFAYTPEQVDALISSDYATLRKEIAECQAKALTELKPPKLKKPKVPRIPGQPPAFWVYVMGSQVETWAWSLPLEPDPIMCTSAISGQRFTVVSPVPAGASPTRGMGNEIGVDVTAGVVNTGWGQGSDCNPDNSAESVKGRVSFDFTTSEIQLNSYIASEQNLGWEYDNNAPTIFTRKFTKKEKAALFNPRKGVLTFTLNHNDAGSAQTDTGSCITWGTDGTCTWAHSWGIKIVLVRAEPMDLVYGP